MANDPRRSALCAEVGYDGSCPHCIATVPSPGASVGAEEQYPGLRDDDLSPMTAEQRAWFDANRQVKPELEPEECRALPEGSGRCAYAGPDGTDACGIHCIYEGNSRA